jgi:Zn ribbon nucleic-acid-binding protein
MKAKTVLITLVALIVCLFILQKIVTKTHNNKPSVLDPFASCLTEKGAKFYGHYQCPHCQDQKELFGTAADSVTYIECGVIGSNMGSGQSQECTDLKIESYPTWIFADKTRISGQQSIAQLAEKTGCEIPADYTAPEEKTPEITATPVVAPTPGANIEVVGEPEVTTKTEDTSEKTLTATVTPAKKN